MKKAAAAAAAVAGRKERRRRSDSRWRRRNINTCWAAERLVFPGLYQAEPATNPQERKLVLKEEE